MSAMSAFEPKLNGTEMEVIGTGMEIIAKLGVVRASAPPSLGGKGGNGHSVLLAGSLFVAEKSPPILGGRDTLGLLFGPRALQPPRIKIV